MFRKKQEDVKSQNILQLAATLQEKTQALEKFFTEDHSIELRDLKPSELAELKKNIDELDPLKKMFDEVLDQEFSALESSGMNFNNKTGEVENIFAKHKTAKVRDGIAFDGSVFSPTDHFGEVIKKGYGLEWKRAPDIIDEKDLTKKAKKNRAGMVRNQACLDMMQQFVENSKKNRVVGDKFILDLIDLRSAELQVYGSAYDVRDYIEELLDPKTDAKQKDMAAVLMGAQLRNAIIASNNIVNPALQKIHGYNHLMFAKDFLAMIPAAHKKNQLLANINQTLILLQGDNVASNFSAFWKQKQQTPVLDDMSRLAHLVNLRGQIIQAQGIEAFNSNAQVKKGLDQIFAQVEYGINKLDGELKRAAIASKNKENISPNQPLKSSRG